MILLLMGLALAEESAEIVVEARQTVSEARAQLDGELEELGYPGGVDLGGRTLYIHPQLWKPKVTVYDSGFVRVKARTVTPLMVAGAGVHGVFSSPRIARGAEQRVLDAIHPELTDWREALIEYGQALRHEQLLAELAALESLPLPMARAHATRLWMNTADTPEGAVVRGLVEDWAEGVLGDDFVDHLLEFEP
jgi:hypothetical protein